MPLSKILLVLTTVAGLTAGAAEAAPKARTAAVKAQMKTIVGPASDALFAIGGEVDPANGPEAQKVPASRWNEAAGAAAKLETAAAALQTPRLSYGKGVWTPSAARMQSLSAAAAKAAKAHDGAALSQAANDLGDVCTACHTPFKPKS